MPLSSSRLFLSARISRQVYHRMPPMKTMTSSVPTPKLKLEITMVSFAAATPERCFPGWPPQCREPSAPRPPEASTVDLCR